VEGCGYRDLQHEFSALGVAIVGVSFDAPADNQAWREDEGFEFELWTDQARELALYYGASTDVSDGAPDRITVLLDPLGNVALEYRESVDVGTHPDHVLEDCRTLWGG
jgi:peroxiredoxin